MKAIRIVLGAVVLFGGASSCSSTTIIAPAVETKDAAPEEVVTDAEPQPIEDADIDAGYCFNSGPQVDAASATVFGHCVANDKPYQYCIEYAGIGVSFAEATAKSNCLTMNDGTWTKAAPCARPNLAGGCRQISRISNLCETVITYWYYAGGDAGTTEADVMSRCSAQGNAKFLPP